MLSAAAQSNWLANDTAFAVQRYDRTLSMPGFCCTNFVSMTCCCSTWTSREVLKDRYNRDYLRLFRLYGTPQASRILRISLENLHLVAEGI